MFRQWLQTFAGSGPRATLFGPVEAKVTYHRLDGRRAAGRRKRAAARSLLRRPNGSIANLRGQGLRAEDARRGSCRAYCWTATRDLQLP
jgi:hypothetical protein